MRNFIRVILLLMLSINVFAQSKVRIQTLNGALQGADSAGIRYFKGVPYAQPPVGDLRWKEPQPLKPWKGIRPALAFANRAMQKPIYQLLLLIRLNTINTITLRFTTCPTKEILKTGYIQNTEIENLYG